jgi:ADP-heptose:LPS heptosyltransferase
MTKQPRSAPWRKRFNLQYTPVIGELPALIRLQSFKPDSVASPQSVLIVNCCLIGDFVVSLPAIRDFILEHPCTEIDLLVSPTVAALARRIRGVRTVYVARTVFSRETELLGSEGQLRSSYDLVVVLRLSGPARRLIAKTSYRAIRTYLVPMFRYSMDLLRRPVTQARQLTEINFEVFGKQGRDDREISVADVLDLTNVPAVGPWPGPIVVVHTGSGKPFYQWPLEKWIALLEALHAYKSDLTFVFVGGTNEEQQAFEQLSARVNFPLHSVIRRYDVLELLMLMRISTLFVGVDSGPRHIAHLVDLPSVSLLGPGPKSFRPLNHNAVVIDETECRKCFTLYCPHAPNCIEKIEVETVVRACRKSLLEASALADPRLTDLPQPEQAAVAFP